MRRRQNTTAPSPHVTVYFMPFVLRAAHLAPGQHVLDLEDAGRELAIDRRQLGAQPASLVTNAITLSNGSSMAFVSNVPPTLSPLRGISVTTSASH